MPRFKCTVEYDGTPYSGWQRQDGQPSVQETIENALHSFVQEDVRVQCAGRTDAGVHAFGQVMHFDLEKERTPYQTMEGINYFLLQNDQPIRILDCDIVDDNFNARFSATGRAYLYRLVNRRAPLAIDQFRAWHVGWPLDVEAMRAGAKLLLGKHDFTSFRATACQADSPIKTLDRLDLIQEGEEIRFIVEARSFLHHQVRNMVGTLERIGAGKWVPDNIPRIIEAKDRREAGQTAPACGLYLARVEYD